MVKKARAAGSFLGGIFNNPGIVILGLVLGGLIIFRDRISEAFAAIPGAVSEGIGDINIQLPEIKLPEITFPDITFPDITFPDFPDFSSLFQGFQDQLSSLAGQTVDGVTIPSDTTVTSEGTVVSSTPPTVDLGLAPGTLDPLGEISFNRLRSQVISGLTGRGFNPSEVFAAFRDISFFDTDKPFKALDDILQQFNTPFTQFTPGVPQPNAVNPQGIVSNLLGTDQEFQGFGQGFTFGQINPTPITTLSQVIDLFPGVTASQAADFLGEFSGILPEAALLQGFDVRNITSAPGDPPQVFNQTSIPGLSGDAEEIFKFLFPNVISNF